jgi:hypothetical protein
MKRHDLGFILLVTLLIIIVVTLLILTSMQHILLYYKAINKQEVVHRSFYQLEKMAMEIAHSPTLLSNQNCIVREDSANQVMHFLRQKKGCNSINGSLHYYYLIEDLGEFPCLVIERDGHKSASYHRRISVMQINDGEPASFLQIRFISIGSVRICYNSEHIVTLGMSSWRYLPEI